jgi:hypothetical protein
METQAARAISCSSQQLLIRLIALIPLSASLYISSHPCLSLFLPPTICQVCKLVLSPVYQPYSVLCLSTCLIICLFMSHSCTSCLSLSLPAYQLVCLSSLYSTCLTPCLRDLLLLFAWLAALLKVCLNPYWSQLQVPGIHSMCYNKCNQAELS